MGIVQIAGLALLCVTLILCLKEMRATLALPARLAAALLLFGGAIALYTPVLERMRALFALSGAADFVLRRQTLYPAELRVPISLYTT